MGRPAHPMAVYLETGARRVFAGALDWPGWCRAGRDQASALQALFAAGPRYARALHAARLGFHAPTDPAAFTLVERLKGSATTDFGAPDASPSADSRPLDPADLKRLQTVLRACWRAFDEARGEAAGRELLTGPRGGGRDQQEIVQHVLDGDRAYLSRLAWKLDLQDAAGSDDALRQTRQAILEALRAAAAGQLPSHGPRGGRLWTPRYFVRRAAWHTLDHAWEIEDRLGPE